MKASAAKRSQLYPWEQSNSVRLHLVDGMQRAAVGERPTQRALQLQARLDCIRRVCLPAWRASVRTNALIVLGRQQIVVGTHMLQL